MNKNLTEVIFILDRSGSMSCLEKDTIGGYNSLLKKQRNEQGEARITTVLFDDQYEMICDHADIKKVEDITEKEYYARGMTALLDAIGKTITYVKNKQKYAPDNEIPANTMVVIITDGMENASSEYSIRQVNKMIEKQKSKGWEFLFLGANMDAVSTAAKFGISSDCAVTYKADEEGTMLNYEVVSETVSCVRECRPITPSWKGKIEKRR